MSKHEDSIREGPKGLLRPARRASRPWSSRLAAARPPRLQAWHQLRSAAAGAARTERRPRVSASWWSATRDSHSRASGCSRWACRSRWPVRSRRYGPAQRAPDRPGRRDQQQVERADDQRGRGPVQARVQAPGGEGRGQGIRRREGRRPSL